MTRQEFAKRLKALGMKQGQFAEAVGYTADSVYRWGEFPLWVDLLLSAWERVAELEGAAKPRKRHG